MEERKKTYTDVWAQCIEGVLTDLMKTIEYLMNPQTGESFANLIDSYMEESDIAVDEFEKVLTTWFESCAKAVQSLEGR